VLVYPKTWPAALVMPLGPPDTLVTGYHNYPRTSAAKFSLLAHGRHHRLSTHFRLGEFACSDGADEVLVHLALVASLEALRLALGGYPMSPHSAYRTWSHHQYIYAEINRARAAEGLPPLKVPPHSLHLYGLAADIRHESHDALSIARIANDLGIGGIGLYKTFAHVDVWKRRQWGIPF